MSDAGIARFMSMATIPQQTLAVLERIEVLLTVIADNTRPTGTPPYDGTDVSDVMQNIAPLETPFMKKVKVKRVK